MIQFTVYGVPKPQGSKRFVGHAKSGKAIMIESCPEVKPWRESVKWAARESVGQQQLAGPVEVSLRFTLPKPKSAPKRRPTYPDRKPDLDKLCRSTIDSLVQSGLIEDDARIVGLQAKKYFPGEGDGALASPGAIISVWKI